MNKLTRTTAKELGIDFNSLLDDFVENSYKEHRKGSNFYTRSIVEINEEWYPDVPREFDGFWETNDYVSHDMWGPELSDITELTRVERKERTIVETYWEKVGFSDRPVLFKQ
jgi:hypothetical protein